MSVYDNSSLHGMHELLQQMKELHAPDRCEGIGNDIWHGIQKRIVSETSQQKIEKYWNSNSSQHAVLLKMLTSGNIASRESLWDICKEVDSSRKPTVDKAQLDAFIDGCKSEQLQLMFDKLIVQWVWRERMWNAWGVK
jgi:hypothetical protein